MMINKLLNVFMLKGKKMSAAFLYNKVLYELNCRSCKYKENMRMGIGTNKVIFTNDLNIYCLPSVLFDPTWILHEKKVTSKYSKLSNFDDFFKTTDEDINTFFDNQIFAYHWHSRNNYKIEKNSYFEKIEYNHLLI